MLANRIWAHGECIASLEAAVLFVIDEAEVQALPDVRRVQDRQHPWE